MSTSSNIEWTDATWNPVVGCTRVSAGCDHCYAVGMTRRLEGMAKVGPGSYGRKQHYAGLTVLNAKGDRHFNGTVRCVEEALDIPLHWRRPRRIFVNSMSDLFHREVPFEFIDKVFAVMALCQQHTFQVLTKRPEQMAQYLASFDDGLGPASGLAKRVFDEQMHAMTRYDFDTTPPGRRLPLEFKLMPCAVWPLPNVWLGTSCEDQAAADERIPYLLRCPAAVRFLSCEPLLGPIDLDAVRYQDGTALVVGPMGGAEWCGAQRRMLHWVIVGGESGAKARLCNVEWVRSIVKQCRVAGVPCFVKQLGSRSVWIASDGDEFPMHLSDRKGGDPTEWPDDLRVREVPAPKGAAAC